METRDKRKRKELGLSLINASNIGALEEVKRLIGTKGVDVNDQTKSGRTALVYACISGRVEVVKLLLEVEGIDVNTQNCFGWVANLFWNI